MKRLTLSLIVLSSTIFAVVPAHNMSSQPLSSTASEKLAPLLTLTPKTPSSQNSTNVGNNSEITKNTPKAKRTYRVRTVRKHTNYFANNTFDFTFNGDVSLIPQALHQYDPDCQVLSSLGTPNKYNINIDLQNTNLNTIQSFISQSTNGRATLQYNSTLDSLRIVFDTKVTVAQDAIKQSLIWQDGGTPSPVLSKEGLVLFPFGQYEPKITCQPLQLCDIQLQAGETINSLSIGDSVNWNKDDSKIPIVYSGPNSKPIPHIILKPVYGGLQTTLVITTDKRTYYIKLLSSDTANVSRAGFYYPGEEIQIMEQTRKDNETTDNKILSDDMPPVNPKDLYFNYSVSGDTSSSFNPVQVFDDGVHVYIQMPTDIKSHPLPVFYILAPDGESLQLVNFRFKSPYYIVDQIFKKGVLIIGLDGNAQRITITRNDKKGFWARLFGG
ncbi:MAG: P-type conjugative transfer protein TrbG [Burkholderiales bacterium]|nr:P-type conjugative transfer protein TrbG [Burkholderiales bacterium]